MFFSFNFQPYIVIIGDIMNSKEIMNRKNVQDKLSRVLENVNQAYSDSIMSKFAITLGDEFQGLLHTGEKTIEIIEYIKMEMYPVKIRFGIGIGSIETDINSEISLGADGSGYYRARNCIEKLKKIEKKKETASSDILIECDDENEMQELSLNSIFKLMYSIEKRWTEKQRAVVNTCLFQHSNQTEISKIFHVTQSNIQQILSKAQFYVYKEVYGSIDKILSEVKHDSKL